MISTDGRELKYVKSIAEGVRDVLLDQPTAFLAGQDVGRAGGVFGSYAGLFEEFGERRVIDTPISEKGMLGLGIGAAAVGCRPIIDLMFMDFLGVCMDEVANQLAKLHYMTGGGMSLPVTILTMAGGGINMAAQHSQSLEAWLAHLPGLKVLMPSNAYDTKGMIIAAARDDNPVFVILNKASLASSSQVPRESYEVEIGVAQIARAGTDISVVAMGRMVNEALIAAKELSKRDISAEVIDVRSIQPFDTLTVVNSVKKTSRALVVHEAVEFCGFGAEIVSEIQDEAFDYLDAPVARLGAPFSPVPFSPTLESQYFPNSDKIVQKVLSVLSQIGRASCRERV